MSQMNKINKYNERIVNTELKIVHVMWGNVSAMKTVAIIF